MKTHLFITIFSMGWLTISAQEIPKNKLYFGEESPTDSARVFAPGFISLSNRNEPCISFSKDLMSAVFYIEFWPDEDDPYVMYTTYKNGSWIEPQKIPFAEGRRTGEPSFDPNDHSRLYLTSTQAKNQQGIIDLCYVEKNGDNWGEPISLGSPPNKDKFQFHPCVIADRSIYFVSSESGDIYKAKYKNGQYLAPEALPYPINGANTSLTWGDPYIDPNETYMIFKSTRKGGYGENDIYISYKREDGKWTNPKNLGPKINTRYDETSGDITPDGKYMTFGRNKDLYWVSSSFIDELKRTNFIPYVNNSIKDLTLTLNKHFAYTIPENTFVDDDGNETLRYRLQMKSGDSVPNWLEFDKEKHEISGTPTENGEYELIIEVIDDQNASSFCGFTIKV